MMRISKYIDAFREEVYGENFLIDILKLSLNYIFLRDIVI
jgi:hypothetical protein